MGITELKKRLYSRTNAILEGCNKKIGLITNLQLQKLLYLSYGEYFLIGGETLPYLQFEAWKMGPVIREIYNRCRSYGYSSIESLVSYDGSFYVSRDAESVDIAIAKYAKLSIHQLIEETHGLAWSEAYKKGENKLIDAKTIKSEFKKREEWKIAQ